MPGCATFRQLQSKRRCQQSRIGFSLIHLFAQVFNDFRRFSVAARSVICHSEDDDSRGSSVCHSSPISFCFLRASFLQRSRLCTIPPASKLMTATATYCPLAPVEHP